MSKRNEINIEIMKIMANNNVKAVMAMASYGGNGINEMKWPAYQRNNLNNGNKNRMK
jgi:hypothetical protein